MAHKLEDQLMATGFVSLAILGRLMVEIALTKERPDEWARDFLTTIHESVDGNEERSRAAGIDPQTYPVHELSRHMVDQLGADVRDLIRLHQSRGKGA